MLKSHFIAVSLATALAISGADAAFGQNFPFKPMRILSTESGSVQDIISRVMAPALSEGFGQPVIVENRPSSVISDFVLRANPDGYTIAMTAATLWLTPLTQKTSYDPVRDFAPISMVVTYPFIIAVNPAVPANSIKELIDLAKAKPGQLNMGATFSPGGLSFLGSELFKAMAGVNIVRVSYKGPPQIISALLTNEIQMTILAPGLLMPHIKSGKMRALAVTSTQPSALAPGLPTVSASGLPGYESATIGGVLAPAGVPGPIINRLNQEIVRVLNRPDVRETCLKTGADVIPSTPQEFAAKISSEIAKWGKVLKDSGVKTEL